MSKFKIILATVIGAASLSSTAFAEVVSTNPFSALSSAIDFSNTIAAVMAVAASGASLLLSMAGVKKIFQFVKKV
ncbi:hypothetical protein AH782_09650 [Salmonella enterica subsp. enterica]|nr:hypothetical protein [Salmonella enterica subsp. enterica serovar Rubislaw]EDK1585462.1 hypothetical protein [Salmonella enterica subsp. enterica serovar Rubislaw]